MFYIPQLHADKHDVLETSKERTRPPNQLAPLYMETGVVTRASGSAYIESGQMKVICSVYGPRQARSDKFSEDAILQCDLRFGTWCKRKTLSLLDNRTFARRIIRTDLEKRLSNNLHDALGMTIRLDQYPKSSIAINVVILECQDRLEQAFPCAVSCASLALADAGLEMYDLTAGVSLALLEDEVFIDPNYDEMIKSQGILSLAFMPNLQQITYIDWNGETENGLERGLNIALDGCCKVYEVMKNALMPHQVDEKDDVEE